MNSRRMSAEEQEIPMTDHRRPSDSRSEADVSEIREPLERMIPRSLEDIVRKARDQFQIGLATAEEMAVLAATVQAGPIRDTITEWRTIAFRAISLSVH